MDELLISVLIPAYNHAAYIREALDSIAAQKINNLEIIVVDDGSSDGTFEIAQAHTQNFPFPTKLFSQENQGVCRTLDRALSHARGQWIALLASDDWFLQDRFKEQLRYAAEHPDVQVLFANGWKMRGDIRLERIHGPNVIAKLNRPLSEIREQLYREKSRFFVQTALFRRSLLQALEPFDDGTGLDDWPLNIRIFNHLTDSGQYHYLDEDVVAYRKHEINSSGNMTAQIQRKVNVINRYCPAHLKDAALANAYWNGGRMLLKNSLSLRPNLRKILYLSIQLIRSSFRSRRKSDGENKPSA